MRFHQLEIGSSFDYHGERYTKSTALIAVKTSDGSQKFMQRSAAVTPVAASETIHPGPGIVGSLPAHEVLKAHETFYKTCLTVISMAGLSEESFEKLQPDIEKAHQQFLNALKDSAG